MLLNMMVVLKKIGMIIWKKYKNTKYKNTKYKNTKYKNIKYKI